MTAKVLDPSEVTEFLSEIRFTKSSIRIVHCHGVFDVVHPGHLEHFRRARELGDFLVVSITADEFINKGPNRPFFDQHKRADFLSVLEIIDLIFIASGDSAVDAIKLVKPTFYVKGSDYKNLKDDITGKIEEERRVVESFGGELVFTDGFTASSTRLINSELRPKNGELSKWTEDIRSKFTLKEILSWIDKITEIEVAIVGEVIIDAYTSCIPLAKSSKDPILAFRKGKSEYYPGGALAIADSMSKWSRKVSIVSFVGSDFQGKFSELTRNSQYTKHLIEVRNRPTILKHRFVDESSSNRVFEYYDFNPESLDKVSERSLIELIGPYLKSKSLILVADYGHGLMTEEIVKEICGSSQFLAVNTQANAGNRGFNTFSKYPRADLLSINGGELELELRKRSIDFEKVVPNIIQERSCRNVIVTLGSRGLITFDSDGTFSRSPALADKVIDRVGAGDSVLAMAALLSSIAAPKEVIGLFSSVVAAFEVAQLGHKSSLSVVNLKRYVSGLLG